MEEHLKEKDNLLDKSESASNDLVDKVKSLEKLLGDSEFQLSNYIASTKKSMRDSEHRLQHAVASVEASQEK
ncbi:hypothetical protein CQW23_02848 [Capsicum baccatum]|uniref:Uncharacterized protein n=1 Tax=Capsicum baccatum TaxID=33114 RepID=A0A2G2XSL4_CAPBA|nr:hypothetical protein CQW23_02848 [Capsicum baccatum]